MTLHAGDIEAQFAPSAGMLGVSLRHRGDELVAMPNSRRNYLAGHTTGIPLLHPWANRLSQWRYSVANVDVDLNGLALHTDGQGLPIHGTLTGDAGWTVVERTETVLTASLDFGARPDLLASFPFPHEVRIEVGLTPRAMTIATSIRATADCAVPVSFGWHPYLQLPRVPRRSWRLVLPERHRVVLDRGIPTGGSVNEPAEAQPLGSRSFDDHYLLGDDRRLAIRGGSRTIWVWLAEGYGHAQVYAPPDKRFVCLEPMTAAVNALVDGTCQLVEPGQTFVAWFEIAIGET